MTITIDYEDFHQSQQELIWFNKDNNSNIEINQVRVFIKNQFVEALDILSENNYPNLDYKIKLLSHFLPEMGNRIAYFHVNKSDNNTHYFYYYLSSVFDHMFEEVQNQSNSNEYYNNVWIHELSHSFDFLELNKFHTDYEKLENYSSDKLQYFFSYLDVFRAEGIATLIEDLLNNDQESEKWFIDENSLKINQNVIQSLNSETYKADITKALPYWCGKNFIINCLFYKLPHLRKDIQNILNKIKDTRYISMKDFTEKFRLNQLYSISIEDYIFINVQRKIKLPIKIDLSKYIIDNILLFYGDNEYVQHFYKIYNLLSKGKENASKEAVFSDYLKEIIGYSMTEVEIKNYYETIIKSEKSDSCYMQLLNSKYHEWMSDKNETAALQLTYVFDNEDTLKDILPIVGRVDDMLVLSFKNSAFL